jgi:hypothetical protein
MAAEQREETAERERPERRRRARHGHTRVVGEAATLGQVAGELEMDPRVVQRKRREADRPGDLTGSQQEEGDADGEPRGRRGEGEAPPLHRRARSKV